MDNPIEPVNPENVVIESVWKTALWSEFEKPYFSELKSYLRQQMRRGVVLYPPPPLIFNAFQKTPFHSVRVVILGQDPYHQPGQAMGLSFSVPKGIAVPRSLQRIYKELERDLGIPPRQHGDLTDWAQQGVLLLNAMLTVERGQAGSHRKVGWQLFTDAVIQAISSHKEGIIFLLWGNFAKGKRHLIDESRHHILEAVHPSPLAGNGFIGCGHFSRVNELLTARGEKKILW